MWSGVPGWTAEDQKASHGRFDPRPVLMVRLPGQSTPQTINQPFPALKEHDMIENFVQKPPAQSEFETWIAAQN
jgi:hypothetical protein